MTAVRETRATVSKQGRAQDCPEPMYVFFSSFVVSLLIFTFFLHNWKTSDGRRSTSQTGVVGPRECREAPGRHEGGEQGNDDSTWRTIITTTGPAVLRDGATVDNNGELPLMRDIHQQGPSQLPCTRYKVIWFGTATAESTWWKRELLPLSLPPPIFPCTLAMRVSFFSFYSFVSSTSYLANTSYP